MPAATPMHFVAQRATKCVGVLFAAICVALALAGTAAATPSAQSSVIGGEVAATAEVPWLAFVRAVTYEGPFTCTGTMIAPRVVLTAGHCVQEPGALAPLPAAYFQVVTGVSNLRASSGRTFSTVEKAIFYPTFSTSKLQTDAGLLILSAPVKAPALALATPADAGLIAGGTPIEIAGWGVLDPDAANIPAGAHLGKLKLQSTSYCLRHSGRGPFAVPRYVPAGQLCALDTPDYRTSGCFGDSGGPAVALRPDGVPVEVGLISGGSPRCARHAVNVYTRVDRISAWALDWIAAAEAGAPPPPTPEASPPYLTFSRANELDHALLTRVFHDHFRAAAGEREKCMRLAWEEVRCRVSWHQGGNRYYGAIGLLFTVEGSKLITIEELTVHWIDERCRGADQSQRCREHTRQVTRRF